MQLQSLRVEYKEMLTIQTLTLILFLTGLFRLTAHI
jgi:hypothetical protein